MDTEELTLSLSPRVSRLTLTVFSLLFTCVSVEGHFKVIGSPQPIVAAPGDDVILPCYVDPQLNVEELTVEWSKPDFKPDPKDRFKHVHLYRDTREVVEMKISSYVMRTALFMEELRKGNISLKITNVTFADEGRYRCFIPKLKGQIRDSTINLVIKPTTTKTWTTEMPLCPQSPHTPDSLEEKDIKGDVSSRSRLFLLPCFLLIVAVGFFITFKSKKIRV
ncbi:myelin-oligodendrocyte glycoprotein-like isoform X2 [Trachinotus anak]|uniref:myelin-oligodendrocyte glycoprotein-like isoform X2 n=1 Tax=Trachinotus anak TaxID=443729 RepID=UPI0039F1C0C4